MGLHLPRRLANAARTKGPVLRVDLTKDSEYYARDDGIIYAVHYPSRHMIMAVRLEFLLETKWDKPELLRVTTRQHGQKLLDVIETRFAGVRSDFVYDPEDMMVTEIDEYDEKGTIIGVVLLSDYAAIDGIQMPRTVAILTGYDQRVWKDPKHNATFQRIKFAFNVEYDPKVFTGPLRAISKDDWKPKKKQN